MVFSVGIYVIYRIKVEISIDDSDTSLLLVCLHDLRPGFPLRETLARSLARKKTQVTQMIYPLFPNLMARGMVCRLLLDELKYL